MEMPTERQKKRPSRPSRSSSRSNNDNTTPPPNRPSTSTPSGVKGMSLDANATEIGEANGERKLETCAIKIQFAFRTYKAMQAMTKDRANLPALDDHGHHNPSTIKMFNSAPVIHIHHHEETFFELFYDLIIVVVLMKLSYLKYDFTIYGFFTVVAIFANFWSSWSLLNVYVTMVHQEDGLHRIFYALHVMCAFIMCLFVEHPEYNFFSFRGQAVYFVTTSIISRLMTVFMYSLFYYNDGRMRNDPTIPHEHLPHYSHEQVYTQVHRQVISMLVACLIFGVTVVMEFTDNHHADCDEHHRRRLDMLEGEWTRYLGASSATDDDCSTDAHSATVILWVLAVLIEQAGSIYGVVFDSLPFSGEYAGERMQAWLMLCFGESVIGMLISPIYYDSGSIKSIMASFVMVFCMVTVYFDVTDADKFLHLFILRKEKWKAFFYCLGHWPFSMFVFFLGVALKTINYIELGIHSLEVTSGCGHSQDEFFRRRQLSTAVIPEHVRRRLASWSLDEYDDLLHKNFLLLCFGVAAVQISSVLVAYAMPSNQKMRYVHYSRLGSVAVALVAVIIPFKIASVKTDCLEKYEDNHRRQLATYSSYTSYSAYAPSYDDDSDVSGLTVVEALILTALIVVVSFIVSFFSIDVDREHTYKELEEAAHHADTHHGDSHHGQGVKERNMSNMSMLSDDNSPGGSRDGISIKIESSETPMMREPRGASIDNNPSDSPGNGGRTLREDFLNQQRSARNSRLSHMSHKLSPKALAEKMERKKKRKELKELRASLPAHDAEGNPNPVSIRLLNVSPVIHIHHHEETFFELFYDLIIVVVLMKLSYLKYDFTVSGFFTVIALFANFWSSWSLLNVYVTMVHQEDGLHRIFYALHVTLAFVMCIFTEHPDHDFFSFTTQAFFFTLCGILSRLLTVGMYGIFYYQDGKMRSNPRLRDHLPHYTREHVSKQVFRQAGAILASCVVFAVACGIEYESNTGADETRRLAGGGDDCDDGRRLTVNESSWISRVLGGSDDYTGCNPTTHADDHIPTIALWIIAVVIEQVGSNYSTIFDSLPFSGEYAGERMQAWLMLCFGESVIGLLINPSYYDSVSIKSIMASFVMVFCLVTVYFDVTDADQFLHLFLLRKEKIKAFIYCFGQWPFSMFVFFIGVALKTINYIELGIHDLEVASGCEHQNESLRRRALMSEEEEVSARRRLSSWTLDGYDDLLHKCFFMLCFATALVQLSSVLVAYAMPTDQVMWKVHVSRFGSVLIALISMIIPFNLASLKTQCLVDYEDSSSSSSYSSYSSTYSSSYSSTYSAYASGDDSENFKKGLTVVEALILTATVVLLSFFVSFFSIDVYREHTYKELEEAAHEGRAVVKQHGNPQVTGMAFLARALAQNQKARESLSSLEEAKGADLA